VNTKPPGPATCYLSRRLENDRSFNHRAALLVERWQGLARDRCRSGFKQRRRGYMAVPFVELFSVANYPQVIDSKIDFRNGAQA
jgi:hypothetical protein